MCKSPTYAAQIYPEQVERLRDACYDEAFPAAVRQRNDGIIALLAETDLDADALVQLDTDALDSDVLATVSSATHRLLRASLSVRETDTTALFASQAGDRLTPEDIDDIVRRAAVVAGVRPYEPGGGRGDPSGVTATAVGREAEPYDGPNGDLVGICRDETDSAEYERTLTALHNSSRELMRAESKADICRVVAETARDVLDLEEAAVHLFDPDESVLQPVAYDRDATLTRDPTTVPAEDSSIIGHVFTTGELTIVDDISHSDLLCTPTDLQSGVFLPLGDHGTVMTGSTEQGVFDEQTVTLVGILAATAEVALDRTEREEQNREWGERVARQRDELETLAQINAVVQEVRHALLQATTREELEQTVCDHLVTSEFYEFAWIAGPEQSGRQAVTLTTAGGDDEELEQLSTAATADVPNVSEGVRQSDEVTVIRSIQNDSDLPDALKDLAADLDFHSCLVVPLTYGNTAFGVLGIVSPHPDAYSEREQFALETLGETIAFAISSVQQRQLLLTDSVVELEFRGTDDEGFFIELSNRFDCRCTLEGMAPGSEGKLLHYVTVSDVSLGRVVAAAEQSNQIQEHRLIEEGEERCLLEVNMSASAPKRLVRAGACIQSAEADCGDTRIVAEVSPDADIRELVDVLRAIYPGLELASRQTVDRPIQTATEFREGLGDRLTDQQRSSLRAAYFAGYYEWPRRSTAQEVADSMEITSPTLHHHLRHSHRKLLESLFETDAL